MTKEHTDNLTQDLLPCPFCRCSVEMVFDGDDPGYEEGGAWENVSITGDHLDLCPFSQTPENGVDYDGLNNSPSQIAAAWNTRTPPAAPQNIAQDRSDAIDITEDPVFCEATSTIEYKNKEIISIEKLRALHWEIRTALSTNPVPAEVIEKCVLALENQDPAGALYFLSPYRKPKEQ